MKNNKIWIWLLIIGFTVAYSVLGIIRHLRLESLGFDLSIYDQMIWLASKGKPLFSTFVGSHIFGDHLTPTLLLLVPLYWFKPEITILLVFQSLIACLGAFPIYLIAKKKLHNEVICLTISLSYLLFFGVQNALIFDFHPIVLAATIVSWILWFYENKKMRYFWLFFILLLGLQENLALFSLALGCYLIFKEKNIKYGLIIILGSLTWFLLAVFMIIPYFNHQKFTYLPLFLSNQNVWEIIKLSYFPLVKLKTVFYWFLAFGFFPLSAPWVWLFIVEEVIQRFIGSPMATRWELGYQYNIILTPVLALATINTIKNLSHFFKNKIIIFKYCSFILLVALIFTQITVKPSLNNFTNKNFFNWPRINLLNYLIAKIPSQASVATTNNLAPHLSHRQFIYLLTNCLTDKSKWIHETRRCLVDNPDYIIADLNPNTNISAYYPDYSREKIINYLEYLESNFLYRKILESDGIVLLKKIDQ